MYHPTYSVTLPAKCIFSDLKYSRLLLLTTDDIETFDIILCGNFKFQGNKGNY